MFQKERNGEKIAGNYIYKKIIQENCRSRRHKFCELKEFTQ